MGNPSYLTRNDADDGHTGIQTGTHEEGNPIGHRPIADTDDMYVALIKLFAVSVPYGGRSTPRHKTDLRELRSVPIHTQTETRVLFAPNDSYGQNPAPIPEALNEKPPLDQPAPPAERVPVNAHQARYFAEQKAKREGRPPPGQLPPAGPPPPGYVTPLHRLGEQPTNVDCPKCKQAVMTRVHKESSESAG